MPIRRFSSSLAGLLCLVSAFSPTLAAGEAEIADRLLRFVNNEVVTQGDVWEKMRLRYTELRRRGADLPRSQQQLQEFQADTLKELTDELLLMQEADRIEVRVDMAGIRREVLEYIRENNLPPTIQQEKFERDLRVKRSKIWTVIRYYGQQWPGVTPLDIRAAYEARKDEFARPPRVQVLRILLRPAAGDDAAVVERLMLNCFQRIQVDPTPEVAATVNDELLTAYVKTPENERGALLKQTLEAVLANAPEQVSEAKTQQLLADINTALERGRNMRDADAVQAELTTLRDKLLQEANLGRRRIAFSKAAESMSQGPKAAEGGKLGWRDPGEETTEFDNIAFQLAIGDVSEVFKTGEFYALLYCVEKQEAAIRGLNEVGAEIESSLEDKNIEELRATILKQLREQGVIKDLEIDPELPPEWFEETKE